MSFNILERLDALTLIKQGSTYAEYYCPVCGEENFKVTLTGERAGAFKCWSSCCDSLDVRKALGCKTIHHESFIKPKTVYNRVNFPKIFQLVSVDKYDLPTTSSYWSNKYSTRVNRTEYIYSPECRVSRIDFIENGKKRKQAYPQHWLEGEWCYGVSSRFPLYNQSYLLNQKGIIFLVEGEKAATVFTDHTGWLALSPPGFGWTEEWLQNTFRKIYWSVDGVFVLPDNDEVGKTKAWKVQQACWSCQLPCEVIDLPHQNSGEDVADLIQSGVDVTSLILERANCFKGKNQNG